VKSDAQILHQVVSIYKDVISSHKDTVKNFVPAILLQPVLPRMLPTDEGENTLGISTNDGPIQGTSQFAPLIEFFTDH
jgi:hypothetical protein